MSIITQQRILERIKKGDIQFSPPIDSFQLQAHSIDLRLGFTFLVPKLWHLTKQGREALNLDYFEKEKSSHFFEVIELEKGQSFEILPQEYVIVSTLETVKVPNDLMAILYPRSSVNRKGLSVDLSGIIDAGYEGLLVIPVKNNTRGQTIKLYPGERFCQVVFQELSEEVQTRKSRYHKKDIVSGSLQSEDEEENEFVRKGEIKELKEKYPIESNESFDKTD